MKNNPNKIFLGLIGAMLFLCILCSGISFYLYDELFQQKIIITNNSEQVISKTEIRYCDKSLKIENIPPEKTITKRISINCDTSFKIKVLFENGSKIEKEDGYSTNSDSSKNYFTIKSLKELEFKQK